MAPNGVTTLDLILLQRHLLLLQEITNPYTLLAADINREQPLVDLLTSGQGRLGKMPQTAAERMLRVLAHHGMKSWLEGETERAAADEHGRSTLWKLLGIGDSYFVALDFAIDRVRKK